MNGYKDKKNNNNETSDITSDLDKELKNINVDFLKDKNTIFTEEKIFMKRESKRHDEKKYINKIRKKHFKLKDVGYTKTKNIFENNLNLLTFLVGFLKSKKFNEEKIAQEIGKIKNIENFNIPEYIKKYKNN